MRQSLKTRGFVLKKRPLLNRDIILTLFSEGLGKINVFAHGARTITSRRLSHIDTGNFITSEIDKREGRYYLKETRLISGFSQIKSNKNKVNYLSVFLFILNRILPEDQREESAYIILRNFLIEISKKNENLNVMNKYLNKLIITLGYSKEEINDERITSYIEDVIGEKLPYI